jgi:hypothetical protein
MEGKGEEGRGGAPFNLSARGPNWLFGRHCTCMNDLTGAKVLKGDRILFNAFKDIYFTSKTKFEN